MMNEIYISIDVEIDGFIFGLYFMLSFGLVVYMVDKEFILYFYC